LRHLLRRHVRISQEILKLIDGLTEDFSLSVQNVRGERCRDLWLRGGRQVLSHRRSQSFRVDVRLATVAATRNAHHYNHRDYRSAKAFRRFISRSPRELVGTLTDLNGSRVVTRKARSGCTCSSHGLTPAVVGYGIRHRQTSPRTPPPVGPEGAFLACQCDAGPQ
jgi:hypothetical protein